MRTDINLTYDWMQVCKIKRIKTDKLYEEFCKTVPPVYDIFDISLPLTITKTRIYTEYLAFIFREEENFTENQKTYDLFREILKLIEMLYVKVRLLNKKGTVIDSMIKPEGEKVSFNCSNLQTLYDKLISDINETYGPDDLVRKFKNTVDMFESKETSIHEIVVLDRLGWKIENSLSYYGEMANDYYLFEGCNSDSETLFVGHTDPTKYIAHRRMGVGLI